MPRSRPPYSPEYRQQMVDLVRGGRTPDSLHSAEGAASSSASEGQPQTAGVTQRRSCVDGACAQLGLCHRTRPNRANQPVLSEIRRYARRATAASACAGARCLQPAEARWGSTVVGLRGRVRPGRRNRAKWRPEVSFGVVRCHLAPRGARPHALLLLVVGAGPPHPGLGQASRPRPHPDDDTAGSTPTVPSRRSVRTAWGRFQMRAARRARRERGARPGDRPGIYELALGGGSARPRASISSVMFSPVPPPCTAKPSGSFRNNAMMQWLLGLRVLKAHRLALGIQFRRGGAPLHNSGAALTG